jgi:hypothetical protein
MTTMSSKSMCSGSGGLGVSMLATGTRVCGFESDRSRRILQGEKNLSIPSGGTGMYMREGTTSRVMAADRPYVESYDF